MAASMTISRPQPFQGSEAEAKTNFATHSFTGIDGRCYFCDARPFLAASAYPCGVSVPRLMEVK